ncbi:MAG TPA: S53 family serine peptidase [Acidisarcina sp.]|nr:S53 family serine peptidase [Acidisarcina sp.]
MRISLPLAVILGLAAAISCIPSAAALEKAKIQDRAPAAQPVEFDLYLPLQHESELDQLLNDLHDPDSSLFQQWLTPQQFAARFAPSTRLMNAISQELRGEGFKVIGVHTHSMHVAGTVGDVERVFSTRVAHASLANGKTVLAATQPLRLSPLLTSAGAIVMDFSDTIHMHSHAQFASAAPEDRYSSAGPYWFDDLKQAYEFPSYQVYTGKGARIGILMTGAYNPADMDLYFGHEKLSTPRIFEVEIRGGAPFDAIASLETHLDIQQAGGMAPGAEIVLYNLPDLSDASIFAGLTTIVESNAVDIVNMSFGSAELGYTAEYNSGVDQLGLLNVWDSLFKQGNAQGITFVASSGDLGAKSIPPPACFDVAATSSCGSFRVSVEVPAASPHVTGVGGTNLITTYSALHPNLDSAYIKEAAWGDPLQMDIFYRTPATGGYWSSGGGTSIFFRRPQFQITSHTGSRMRAVPDLALHMGGCPFGAEWPCHPDRSSVVTVSGGTLYQVIGTSAASPAFAGLTALKIERSGHRQGNENYAIYALAAAQEKSPTLRVFHTNISGFNGKYYTGPRYNMVLGNGTLYGKDFILAPNVPSAGVPQTPSNP